MAAGAVPQTRSLLCPNCGAAVELRTGAQSVNAVCGYCHTILDTRSTSLTVIQQFEARQEYKPVISLGTRGRIAGGEFETIGFQVRAIEVDGIEYTWSEYLLYNPYRGYRYLSDYRGHWNVIRTLRFLPGHTFKGNKKAVRVGGETYVHFQTAKAQTIFVIGEFPWQIRVGESVHVEDFIAPPKMVSAEITDDEITWSQGEYTPGSEIFKAFRLPGSPDPPAGVFANQPSPFRGTVGSVWRLYFLFLLMLFAVMAASCINARNETVFSQRYAFSTATPGENSFVTPVFELKGRTSNVEVEIHTDLANDWVSLGFALINDDTGQAFDFGKELEYYYGTDSDGAWTEGSRSGSVSVPSVPSGRYYLRVEPEMDKTLARTHSVNYELAVKRDTPGMGWYLVAFFLLIVPPILVTYRVFQFEGARWAESDYGGLFGSGQSGDDEED